MASPPLKALVVSDRVVMRKRLSEAVDAIDLTEVIATAPNEKSALDKLRRNREVDLLIVDVDMPGGAAVSLVENALRDAVNLKAIVVGDGTRESADRTLAALESGALDFAEYPRKAHDSPGFPEPFLLQLTRISRLVSTHKNVEFIRQSIQPLSPVPLQAEPAPQGEEETSAVPEPVAPAGTAPAPKPGPPVHRILTRRTPSEIRVIAVSVSTGGPNALAEFIPKLPETLPIPVLIVQHMPPLFTASLAGSLNKRSKLEVVEACDGDIVEAGRVYLARGGRHMDLALEAATPPSSRRNVVIRLTDTPPENSCKPAADVLLRAVAEIFGEHALSIIMTGMGNDGLQGTRAIRERGGYCLSQSEETCVVYGMPAAVDKAGLSDEQVPIDLLAQRVISIVEREESRS